MVQQPAGERVLVRLLLALCVLAVVLTALTGAESRTERQIIGRWRVTGSAGPGEWSFSPDGKVSVSWGGGRPNVRDYKVLDAKHISIDSSTSHFVYEVGWSGRNEVSLSKTPAPNPGEGMYGFTLERDAK